MSVCWSHCFWIFSSIYELDSLLLSLIFCTQSLTYLSSLVHSLCGKIYYIMSNIWLPYNLSLLSIVYCPNLLWYDAFQTSATADVCSPSPSYNIVNLIPPGQAQDLLSYYSSCVGTYVDFIKALLFFKFLFFILFFFLLKNDRYFSFFSWFKKLLLLKK